MRSLLQLTAGVVPYARAYGWQRSLHARRVAGTIPDVVLMLQHPHVFTLGRRFDPSHLLTGREELQMRGIEVHESDRGGSITYHGPGQLVLYPIVDLRATPEVTPDPVAYLRLLERAVRDGCVELGVRAGTREGLTGVWVGEDKLAAIGIHVSRGVTRHGCAVNVCTDLEFFSSMVPCGIAGGGVTSLQALGTRASMERVASVMTRSLARHLSRELAAGSADDLPELLGRSGPPESRREPVHA